MTMKQALVLYCIVSCKADDLSAVESSMDIGAFGSWLREKVGNVSHSINDRISKKPDIIDEDDLPSVNGSRKASFWDPSEWRLWNATNGLLNKERQKDRKDNVTNEIDSDVPASSPDATQSSNESAEGSFWHHFGYWPKIKERWEQSPSPPPENTTASKDQLADPSGVRAKAADGDVIGDRDGDGIVDVTVPAVYNSGGLLPSDDILEALKCRPTISFSSCFHHCLSLVVPSAGEHGYSLTQNLMYPQASTPKRLLIAEVEASSTNDTNTRASKKLAPKYMPEESPPRSFDAWEVSQLQNCVVSVCTRDYIKTPLPGCLDSNGDIVRITPDRVKPIETGKDPRTVGDYQKLDFYDPGRLEFWHGMGFFTLQRIWFEIVHGKGLFKLVFLPSAVMLLLSLPMFLLALIVPGMTTLIPGENPQDPPPPSSRSVMSRPAMSLQAMDIDDYGEVVHPSSIRLCDATLANSKLLGYLKLMVDGLTLLSSKVSYMVNLAFMRSSSLLSAQSPSYDALSGAQSAPGLVEMIDRSNMKYSPLPSSELVPAEEDAERGKRCPPPGTVTTLPSTGKTLPSPTHEDRKYFHRFD